MLGNRSFRQRIFLAILLVALLPAAGAVALGALGLREIGTTVGTLGPWDAVAGSGRTLIEAARTAAPDDSAVLAAAEAHGEALSRSVRWSRLSAFVTDRFVRVLPWIAVATAALIGLLAFLTAHRLARGFGEPIRELVGWTGRIARGKPLPPRNQGDVRGIEEFAALRSSLRAMDAQLREARRREVESARLKAWTEMARRVAHELKNPLTPMRMAATTLALEENPDHAETGRVLLDEIRRLDEMARTFSQFGRMPEGPASEVDLPELLTSLAERHGEEGRVVVQAEDDLPTVRGHLEVLNRAFRNLLVNGLEAADTAPEPRREPRTEGQEIDRAVADGGATEQPLPAVVVLVDRSADGVRVRIRDRGPGIRADLLDTLWNPEVTTKRRGTGLGLAIVRQAVDAHGGRVAARNAREEGFGAEFEVVLPTDPPPAKPAPGSPSVVETAPRETT